ncbi:DUF4153 domain-containing protein [Nocardioides solisilvae]|uniref:DUF4153 domain-containing protein n=1 Tax=Nocardioides solisilvae TaxID=1542435 RepID=UPI000D74A750|nr:DUF4153 domain-containing protein [Nocardioides solisilvae]
MSALVALGSIRTKLGVLVGASVLVAALVGTVGAASGVPAWLSLPVTVVLALAVTQLLAAGMVAPLREMTLAAERMARGGHGVRVLTDSRDEVGQLAAAFNTMAADLAHVDAERRDLVATVSHELRTPVAALAAQLENLADGVVPADPRHLDEALGSAQRLGDLLGDLLALSRLEAGVVELEPVPVALAAEVLECAAEVRRAGRRLDVRLEVPESMTVRVDPPRLRQLLVNVLDNAARHTPDGETVRVLAGPGGTGGSDGPGSWWLEVRDAGPGVPPADRERVFERFGTDAQGGGTGLGLAVARWVARLHGGTLGFAEPEAGRGARLRLEVPVRPAPTARPGTPAAQPAARTGSAVSATEQAGVATDPGVDGVPVGPSTLDQLFGASWPERAPAPDLRLVGAALAVGLLAGATMAFAGPGLSWALVLLLAGACAWAASSRRTRPWTLGCAALAGALVTSTGVRANDGLAVLAVLVAAGVFLSGATGAHTFRGMLLSGVAWPAAGLRGLPWLGRTLRLVGAGGRGPAVVRTALLAAAGVTVFALLFASADLTFARWVDSLVPDADLDEAVARGFVTLAVLGMTLAASYLARNPARVDPRASGPVPARSRWEWLVPLVAVDAVFLVFVAAQARVVLGGDDYVQRTAGLGYADYAREGFGQLVVATALTLVVLWAAGRRVGPGTGDRVRFRVAAGLLGFLTLVVVAAALARMAVYQDAYGFTTARLVVNVLEGWLGFVVLSVLVLGLLGRAAWAPRLALLTGAGALLGLLAVNPDAWVAARNIDLYERTGHLDAAYLAELSDDAVPVVVDRLPRDVARCVMDLRRGGEDEPGWQDWTWGTEHAERALRAAGLPTTAPAGGAAPAAPGCRALLPPAGPGVTG